MRGCGLRVRQAAGWRPDGELVLARHEAAPQTWQAPLTAELSEAGAGDDAGLTAAAQALMEPPRCGGAQAGKYAVVVSGLAGRAGR